MLPALWRLAATNSRSRAIVDNLHSGRRFFTFLLAATTSTMCLGIGKWTSTQYSGTEHIVYPLPRQLAASIAYSARDCLAFLSPQSLPTIHFYCKYSTRSSICWHLGFGCPGCLNSITSSALTNTTRLSGNRCAIAPGMTISCGEPLDSFFVSQVKYSLAVFPQSWKSGA